jgi:hypothetical protein
VRLWGRESQTNDGLKRRVLNWLPSEGKTFYAAGISDLPGRWKKCGENILKRSESLPILACIFFLYKNKVHASLKPLSYACLFYFVYSCICIIHVLQVNTNSLEEYGAYIFRVNVSTVWRLSPVHRSYWPESGSSSPPPALDPSGHLPYTRLRNLTTSLPYSIVPLKWKQCVPPKRFSAYYTTRGHIPRDCNMNSYWCLLKC